MRKEKVPGNLQSKRYFSLFV